MGALISNDLVGSFGDFVVYSTGHSKTIDIGNGGVLSADVIDESIIDLYNDLPYYSDSIGADDAFFSRLYRLVRNNPNTSWTFHIYKSLSQLAQRLFLYRATDAIEKKMLEALSNIDEIVKQRKTECEMYDRLILPCDNLEKYEFSVGACPWRYNIFVSPDIRKDFVDFLLSNNVPVSDWYPDVTPLFFEDKSFANASLFEKHILNLPLLIGQEKIKEYCNVVNSFFR